MTTKARELDNRRDGDRRACTACNPARPGTVTANDLWQRMLHRAQHDGTASVRVPRR